MAFPLKWKFCNWMFWKGANSKELRGVLLALLLFITAMSPRLNKSPINIRRNNYKWCLFHEKGVERSQMQKIKPVSQKPGGLFAQILSDIDLHCEGSRTPDSEINRLLSQIVLLAFSYPVFSLLLTFLDSNIKESLSFHPTTSEHCKRKCLGLTLRRDAASVPHFPHLWNGIATPGMATSVCYCGDQIRQQMWKSNVN